MGGPSIHDGDRREQKRVRGNNWLRHFWTAPKPKNSKIFTILKIERRKILFTHCPPLAFNKISVTIMCHNDELSWTMSWFGCLLPDSELFILFAENNQILLKISVIPILLTFMYLVALNLLANNQLNSSSNSTHHWGT